MIAFLEGKIQLKTDKFAVLNVGGVGYKVFCADASFNKMEEGAKACFFIHHHIRENSAELYGFLAYEDLEFFELLLSVNGVGPKAALAIMASSPVKNLKRAIASGDKTLLTKVSGIGKRTAERILVELQDKVFATKEEIDKLTSDNEALDALMALGYSKHQATKALKDVPVKISQIEDRVKEALKILGRGK